MDPGIRVRGLQPPFPFEKKKQKKKQWSKVRKEVKEGEKTEKLYRVFFIYFLFWVSTPIFPRNIVNERKWDHKMEAYK